MQPHLDQTAPIPFDAHVHSARSDGRLTPAGVVQLAKLLGLRALALTDHDVVSGIEEAQKEGQRLGVAVIAGVEWSTCWAGQEIHILGYGIDPHHPAIREREKTAAQERTTMIRLWIAELARRGFPQVDEESLHTLYGPFVERWPLLWTVAHKAKLAYTALRNLAEELFATMPCPFSLTPAEAIRLIHQAGGVAALAHPCVYNGTRRGLALAYRLIREGLDGLEVAHPAHRTEDRVACSIFARRHHLLWIGGSDFHGTGPNGPASALRDEQLAAWHRRLNHLAGSQTIDAETLLQACEKRRAHETVV